jgi:hypothetical protein
MLRLITTWVTNLAYVKSVTHTEAIQSTDTLTLTSQAHTQYLSKIQKVANEEKLGL